VEREDEQSKISSELDYLRAKEEEESNRKREKRLSSGAKHSKRSSLSSLSFSGSKNLLAGRFGEAFRRFESSNPEKPSNPSAEDQPQLQQALVSDSEAYDEANESPSQYEYADLDDIDRDDISPEMRRELERRRLSQEEKRVATAAAEYRRRVAENEGGRAGADGHRSRAIQNRVQTLFGESNKPPPPPKTASGYGKYTDTSALQAKQNDMQSPTSSKLSISRTPGPVYGAREETMAQPDRREGASASAGLPQATTSNSTGYSSSSRPAGRPAAPPKPKNLRVGTQDTSRPSTGHDRSPSSQATPSGEDWEANFSRRFPSLSGLEVETEIEIPKYPKLRTREV
jgi:AP2-associated kinase